MFQPSPTKGLLVSVAAVMAVASLLLSLITWSRITDSIAAVERSLRLLFAWEETISLMKDAETSHRGYQITGDESFLKLFDRVERRLPEHFTELTALQLADEKGVDGVAEVRALADEKFAEMRSAIASRRRDGQEAAGALIAAGRGRELMDRLRRTVSTNTRRLSQTATSRSGQMQTDLKWGYVSALATGVVALAAGVVSLLLFRESLRQLRRESRLAAAKQRAEEADRQKSTFLATMSHEIRTPMNAILGFGELLESEVRTEKERRYVASILSGGRALLQLINDILDLSKIEAGMMAVNADPTDVRELGDFTRQLFAQQAFSKGVDLRIEYTPDLPRSLIVDSGRLRQIVINLVGNALKFTDRGFIALRFGGRTHPAALNRWTLSIQVEDTGIGIPQEHVTDIFKPFVQTGERRADDPKGTGLGLAIVKRLTELMGGVVCVESDPNRGTLFAVEFPDIEISARLPQASTAADRGVDFNDLQPSTVLVADDNPTNRNLVRGIFDGTHHTLRLVSDGREAVTSILANPPDIVLMDIRMPVMDGRQALAQLRQKRELHLLPIIAVTASSLMADEQDLRRDFSGYIRKPFSRADLFRELAQFIPRVSAHEPPADTDPRLPAAAASPADWVALVSSLREMEATFWPSVRDGLALTQVAAFAGRLQSLAQNASCPPLATYASRLLADAEAFAIDSLEQSLASFPSIIAGIEHHTLSPPP